MAKQVKGLVVNWTPKDPAEREAINALRTVLDALAHGAGYDDFQKMTRSLWVDAAEEFVKYVECMPHASPDLKRIAAEYRQRVRSETLRDLVMARVDAVLDRAARL